MKSNEKKNYKIGDLVTAKYGYGEDNVLIILTEQNSSNAFYYYLYQCYSITNNTYSFYTDQELFPYDR